ncbi:hypothetical protein PBR31_00002 [Xanthomonas phage PBR31]|uniref:Uncharacterized protein n=1 Tax=Xanthomonas phage PPDBI TaxID=2723911 RepID=A0A6H0X5N0_9CAUD|nr:hypothetical protein [Ralstonia pickettii]NYS09342.1 hypothetical protein [Ralstonia pickettii]QIN95313.1 hypothetical protein PBR31_00002 [Xanthomonas phage PBR31]QIW89361.1 hypothetical protein PPDBI_00002 [Xanthomonas phage PPDBI]
MRRITFLAACKEGLVSVLGYEFEYMGHKFAAHRYLTLSKLPGHTWTVSHVATGGRCGPVRFTRHEAIEDGKEYLALKGFDALREAIHKFEQDNKELFPEAA